MLKEKVVYVAIHPHNAYGIYDKNKDYAKKRDERLSDLKLEHIILIDQPYLPPEEHKPDIIATKEKVDLENPYWQGRIFLTRHGNSEASNYNSSERLDFQQLSKFIREMFPADKYIFWGAELHRPPVDLDSRDKTTRMIWEQKNNISYGCVIFYYDILDLPSKFIDERYCCVFDW